MLRQLSVALLVLSIAAQAMADGKMFAREQVPPTIPFQRALILYKDATETIVLQSKYRLPPAGSATPVGWVVPAPAVPEIASMRADQAEQLFRALSFASQPTVTRVRDWIFGGLFLGVQGLALLVVALWLVSLARRPPPWFERNRGKLVISALCALLGGWTVLLLSSSLALSKSVHGVDVITAQTVGVYDVRVVKSDTAAGLISWLNENQFQFGDEDKASLDSYVAQGWCFVVANINPAAGKEAGAVVAEGLAAPLILRFATTAPIYPLALTGTSNHETEVLIYLVSDTKMTCDDRLTLRYAGEVDGERLDQRLAEGTTPESFFAPHAFAAPYLCKFKSTLSPAQMVQDLTFVKASDNEPYRERLVMW